MDTVVLKQNGDFQRLYHRGKSQVHSVLVTYAMKNRRGVCRFGITTGKKVGNAVARNRARRVIREALRTLEPHITVGFDLVFVARSRTPSQKSTAVSRVMAAQLGALGVLPPSPEKEKQ